MVKVRCLDSWISTLTEGKEYVILATHFPYVCVELDDGRIAWEYNRLFSECNEEVVDDMYKYRTNWEVL